MLARSWHWLTNWTDEKIFYCSKCNKDMPFRRSIVDGTWVCQRCGHRG
jgi:DNA-directed RNA polymerase subunit RPC12/RpoP